MAFLPPWACILVGCFSVALAEVSSLSDLYPPLWKDSPGQFSGYRVDNGKYIIDPWVYPERLGMYKILLSQTARYFEKFAPGNEQNLLWGLPLQHGWQYSTGRLADPSQRTDCGYESGDHLCISVDSWWADMNYFLSALPFLAAVDSGIMGISPDQVMLLPPPKIQTRFCLTVATCQSSFPVLMRKWNTFYQHLKLPSSSFEDLLKYLWAAHSSTLEDLHKTFDDRLEYYSQPEAYFGKSWSCAVGYIAVVRLPTNLTLTHDFQKSLPPRMLVNGDRAPVISDFTELQNAVLFGLNLLHEVDNSTVCYVEDVTSLLMNLQSLNVFVHFTQFSGSLSLAIWKILMRTQAARKLVLEFLKVILENYNPTLFGND